MHLSDPWHWSVSGMAIALILFSLTWLGEKFGVSTAFESICNLAGAGKPLSYFDFDIRDHYWRLTFVLGALIGGVIAANYLNSPAAVAISAETLSHLEQDWQMTYPQGGGFLPVSLFNLGNLKGVLLAILGGFLVGFGSRYAKGCTSGHAISGLAHFQFPSLLTVIGFFLGGLTMTWLIMPILFG